MAKVVRQLINGEPESLDSMLRRFKKQVLNDGIMQDLEKHDHFMPVPTKRKLKSEAARRREAKNNKQ